MCYQPLTTWLKLESARAAARIILLRFLAFTLLASGAVFLGASVEAGTNAAAVPRCTSFNQLSAKFVSPNGAGGWFYFLISFTNEGATACSLSGVPIAQPVNGSARAPVGPVATYYPTDGV